MDPHYMDMPRKILVGNGVIEKVSDVCDDLDIFGKALILSGPKTREVAGQRVKESLSMDSDVVTVNSANQDEVKRIKALVKGMSVIIGVGGGKVIDIGKMVAFERNLPFISIPTSPSHDGIASERVSISDGNERYSLKAKPPIAIMADIGILREAPYRLIASGGADVISNYTSVFDWKLGREKGEYYSVYASDMALLSSDIVVKSAELIKRVDERGIRNLVEALIASGMAMSMAQSSRPASGSEHMFSHAMDNLGSPALHGEQCGLGTIIMAYLQGQNWENIKNSLKILGAPTAAKDIGIKENVVVEALIKARDIRDRHTILNEKNLDKQKALDVCRATGVIE